MTGRAEGRRRGQLQERSPATARRPRNHWVCGFRSPARASRNPHGLAPRLSPRDATRGQGGRAGRHTNRLNTVTDAAGATGGVAWDIEAGSFTYHADGNLATAPAPYSITATTYNAMDLPESITAGGVTSTYRYDNAGQLISKKVGSGNVEYTIRDGATTLGAFTLNGSGTPTSWHFNILAGGAAIGRHTNAGARFYYHTDMLGSTRAVVNASGTVTEAYNYYAFGLLNEGLSYSPGATKEQFTGKERDAETHMSYFGARYYMPALGRWGVVDPMADQFPGWSPYNYVMNSPALAVDPNGLSPCEAGQSTTECVGKLFEAAPDPGRRTSTLSTFDRSGANAISFDMPAGGCQPLPACLYTEGGIRQAAVAAMEGTAEVMNKIGNGILSTLALAAMVFTPGDELAAGAAGAVRVFELAPRVASQLADRRLGRLAGKLTGERLQSLVNSPVARRFMDARTGHINVVQEVDGILLRITTPRDAFRIISVGRMTPNGLANGIANGRFVPLR